MALPQLTNIPRPIVAAIKASRNSGGKPLALNRDLSHFLAIWKHGQLLDVLFSRRQRCGLSMVRVRSPKEEIRTKRTSWTILSKSLLVPPAGGSCSPARASIRRGGSGVPEGRKNAFWIAGAILRSRPENFPVRLFYQPILGLVPRSPPFMPEKPSTRVLGKAADRRRQSCSRPACCRRVWPWRRLPCRCPSRGL